MRELINFLVQLSFTAPAFICVAAVFICAVIHWNEHRRVSIILASCALGLAINKMLGLGMSYVVQSTRGNFPTWYFVFSAVLYNTVWAALFYSVFTNRPQKELNPIVKQWNLKHLILAITYACIFTAFAVQLRWFEYLFGLLEFSLTRMGLVYEIPFLVILCVAGWKALNSKRDFPVVNVLVLVCIAGFLGLSILKYVTYYARINRNSALWNSRQLVMSLNELWQAASFAILGVAAYLGRENTFQQITDNRRPQPQTQRPPFARCPRCSSIT